MEDEKKTLEGNEVQDVNIQELRNYDEEEN